MKKHLLIQTIISTVMAATAWGGVDPSTLNQLALPDGRHLVVESERVASSQWVVYLPGSSCSLFPMPDSLWIKVLTSQKPMNVLVINKSGVDLTDSCATSEFDLASIRATRINDIETVMTSLIPKGDTIWLIGESEGAYIAPDIALADARVNKLILISPGTRSWVDEEVSFAPADKQAALMNFFQTTVIGNPSLTQFYQGWSYAEIDSYNTRQTYTSLQRTYIPVLIMNGEKDTATWVQATASDVSDLIQNQGKVNIEFHLIAGANHALGCDAPSLSCQPSSVSTLEINFMTNFMARPLIQN